LQQEECAAHQQDNAGNRNSAISEPVCSRTSYADHEIRRKRRVFTPDPVKENSCCRYEQYDSKEIKNGFHIASPRATQIVG
jgi:hypothetical protein